MNQVAANDIASAVLVNENNGYYEIIGDPIEDIAEEFAGQAIVIVEDLTGWPYDLAIRCTGEYECVRWYFVDRLVQGSGESLGQIAARWEGGSR